MNGQQNILLAFYGDDFTGSTDALEFISRAGAKAVLFTDPPAEEMLRRFPGINAYGIAGMTRSLSPADMEKQLRPALASMKDSGAKHVHYKVCSTFDSSADVGSIGLAIDLGLQIFDNRVLPILGGMPALGRFCVFGNLFARMGTGADGPVYRIDRHPSMSRHPVTPAKESDLRFHLGTQTDENIGLIDFVRQRTSPACWLPELDDRQRAFLLDVIDDDALQKIGEWLIALETSVGCQFTVGSSAVEQALGAGWRKLGVFEAVSDIEAVLPVKQILVASGSCSPVTAAQIEWAVTQGFGHEVIDPLKMTDDCSLLESTLAELEAKIKAGKSMIISAGQRQQELLPASQLGSLLGKMLSSLVQRTSLKRVVVAGGDTSSYAARAMGIDAVAVSSSLVSGAPLCKAYSSVPAIDGLEVNFKGGQVGGEDYFGMLLTGKNISRVTHE